MGHVVIRNEQAVFVGGGIGVSCTIQRISVHRPHVGEGHIVQGAVCLGAAVKGAVHRAGNPQRRQVEIVSAAGGKGKLFVDPFFHRQRNVCEITCVIGIIIAVALLAEHLEGIVARRKVAGNRYGLTSSYKQFSKSITEMFSLLLDKTYSTSKRTNPSILLPE